MYRNTIVAVAVPAHNEERLVARTILSVPDYVDVVVAVDDASDDATSAEIARAASIDGRVVAMAHDTNLGVGKAVVTAMCAALGRGAGVVAVMDGDGQMHPDDLSALLDPVVSGRADLAKGFRFDGLRPRGPMPLARVIGNHVLSAGTRIVAGHSGPLDSQCGFVAVSAEAFMRLPLERLYPRYGFPNDLVIRTLEAGLRIESVPIRAVYGAEVSGIRPHVAIPRILGLLARAAARRAVGYGRVLRPATAEADEG